MPKAIRTEITEMTAKIKTASFEPKKGSEECSQCDYTHIYVIKRPDWRELKWSIKRV